MTLSVRNVKTQNEFMNSFLVVNTFVWYFFAFSVLRYLIENANLQYIDALIVWTLNFGGAAVSALSSAKIAHWFERRFLFLNVCLFVGFLSSLAPIFVNMTPVNLRLISVFYGVSFGLSMPLCMEYFEEATTIENRGRLGGILFFITAIIVFILSILGLGNFFAEVLISALWRGSALITLFFMKPVEKTKNRNTPSFISILKDRHFLLYITPWWMFCLINYTTIPITNNFFGDSFVRFSSVIESVVVSAFAIVAGYFADTFGRKRVAMLGFAILGLGYAILGIYPNHIFSWYLYTIFDGVAWGTFSVVFLIVLWGDIAKDLSSGKYYAIGGLPFLLSNFIRITISSYIIETVSVYTIFSLASFFLFLAVVPLMYAPETLPEKTIRERELRSYVERAKRIREKFT